MNFNERCYELLRKVPKGKVTTYKALAHAVGTRAYRAVGNAMNKNPDSFLTTKKTPCHRVINANGDIGGFAGNVKEKIRLLQEEGVVIVNNTIDLKKFEYIFR